MFSKSLFGSFHDAAREGDVKKLTARLRKGSDIDERDDRGRTALFYASREGQKAAVKLLVEQDADVRIGSSQGDTPLFQASQRGHRAVVEMLMNFGGDPNERNVDI